MNSLRFAPLCALVLLFSSALQSRQAAQERELLPLKRIFSKPYLPGSRPGGAFISPDSKRILFRWDSTARSSARFWIANADGSDEHMLPDTLLGEIAWSPDMSRAACTRKGDLFFADPAFSSFERITKTEADENDLHWSHDGKLLAFSSGKALCAVAAGTPGINELARVTEKEGSLSFTGFTPDDKKIVFTESTDEGLPDFIVPKFTGKEVTTRSFKGGVSKTRIGIAPVDTGKTVWVALPGDDHFFLGDVAVSPDGKTVIVERFSADRKTRQIFSADTDSGKADLIYEEHDDAWVEGAMYTTRWMPDGKHLLTTSEREGWNHLYMMNPDGSGKKKLTDGPWEVRWYDVDPKGTTVYFLANRDDHAQWQVYGLDLASGAISRLSRREGTYEDLRLAKDGSFLLGRYSAFDKPQELVRIPAGPAPAVAAAGGNASSTFLHEEHLLTHSIPEEFRRTKWVIPEIVHFKSRDGVTVPAMIYKPRDFDSTRKYPAVVFVHGAGYLQNVVNGWGYYDREYMFHTRLTQKGYVVYEVEYRGSAGLGRSYRTDVYMHLGGKDLDDEVDGLEYLKHLGYIDPDRVGLYGGSYGGFMTLMGLFLTNEYACGAALRAVTSWENYYRHNPWYTQARLGTPEKNAEAYRISSPITYADSLKKPLLILHGMVDDNVFFQDAVQLISKLQKSEKKFEVMVYPDESHSFHDPESWYDEYSRIERFFDTYLMK